MYKGWMNVAWSSDALTIFSGLNDDKDLDLRETILGILQIRDRHDSYNWSFSWNRRSTNLVADCMARSSLATNLDLYFDNSVLTSIPFNISSFLSNNLLGKSRL